jgi:transcriptional regulator with XRE-family HTH domain
MATSPTKFAPTRKGGQLRAQKVDQHVAAKVRERRIMLGFSQQEVAKRIGITCQQVHKYETSSNRIAVGRLHQLAQVLGVEVSYFFQDLERGRHSGTTERQRIMLAIIRSVAKLPSRRQQEAFCQLAKALAAPDATADMGTGEAQLAVG